MSLNPVLQQLADALDAMRDASSRYEDDPKMDAAKAKAKADGALDLFAAYAAVRRIVACINACAGMSTEQLEELDNGQLADIGHYWLRDS